MDWKVLKPSLPQLAADRMRGLLRSGVFGEEMPGEMVLSARLQISRRTLRLALRQLEDEGVLAGSQGRRRRVVNLPGKLEPSGPGLVVFVAPDHEDSLSPNALRQVHHLRGLLAEQQLLLETRSSPAYRQKRPGPSLSALVKQNPATAWILHQSTPAMQEWFSAQRLPCVVDGTPDERFGLPGVDLDWKAIGFHAAGELHRLGHRRIGVIEPERSAVGLRRLNEGLAAGTAADGRIEYARHRGPPEQVAQLTRRLLAAPVAPTALVVHELRDLVPVWLAVLASGRGIPGDVCVLATDNDPGLARFLPAVAHYRRNAPQHASRLRQRVLLALRGTPIPDPVHLLNADFVPAGSLVRMRDSGL